jgi:hypothetical protein
MQLTRLHLINRFAVWTDDIEGATAETTSLKDLIEPRDKACVAITLLLAILL